MTIQTAEDNSNMDEAEKKVSNTQGSERFPQTFPAQLYKLLQDASSHGFDDIVSWLPSGDGFKVHKKDKFEANIMSRYFKKQTKCKSFLRQLNLYGFHRVTSGRNRGCYVHKSFRRERPSLCKDLQRAKKESFGAVGSSSHMTKQQNQPGSPRRSLISPASSVVDLQSVLIDHASFDAPLVEKREEMLDVSGNAISVSSGTSVCSTTTTATEEGPFVYNLCSTSRGEPASPAFMQTLKHPAPNLNHMFPADIATEIIATFGASY